MGTTVQVSVGNVGRPGTGPPSGPPVRGVGNGQAIRVGYYNYAGRGQQYLQAATALQLLTTASLDPDVALGIVAANRWPGFTPPANKVSGPGGRASAIAWIKYADDNPALPNGSHVLRRPLVFVEGIDFADYRNNAGNSGKNHAIVATGPLPLSDFTTGSAQQFGGYRNGEAGWNEMVDYNPGYKSLEKFADLRTQLQAPRGQTGFANGIEGGGYDIIYFDFSDGASLIQHNAMALAELLQWVNAPANRAANADETIVIGTSMGGQVARFALAWMEQQQLCHNSKLYVSFDSPHRGANVPIGLQHLFDRLQGAWVGSGSAEDVVQNKLRREATEQMVVFHFATEATAYRNQWQTWQASPGSYPSLLRKVAVANGSGQAAFSPDMSPGMLMLRTSVNPLRGTPLIVGTNYAYALGRSDHTVFRYQRPFSATDHRLTSDPGWGNYDTAPGCRSRTAGDAQDVSDHNLVSGGDFNTFMPTISTLDVQDAGSINNPNFGYNVANEMIAADKPNRAKYAFDAYFAAGGVNEPHVQITNGQASAYSYNYNTSYFTDNSRWIQNELQESAHRLPATLPFARPAPAAPVTAYNYGSAYRHLLPSVQLNNGGVLYLNNGTLPASGGTAATQVLPTAGNFEVYTANCATVVQVNSGGQLVVGTTSSYTAGLRMAANSLLDLRAGSQATVGPGSVLRIAAGATLVVRRGATLALNGLLAVDPGGYVCIEDPASLVLGAAGQLALHPQAHYFANLGLNLTGLACQSCLTQGYLTVNDGQLNPPATCAADSAVFTITDSRGAQTTYAWQVSHGTIAAGQGTSQITVTGLPFQNYTLQVYVSAPATCAGAADLEQSVAQQYYTSSPNGNFCLDEGRGSFAALYPNPATDEVEVHLTPEAADQRAPGAPLTVRLFDAQGQPRAEQTSQGEAVLRLSTRQLPNGLYFVQLLRNNQVIGRQQLKIAR